LNIANYDYFSYVRYGLNNKQEVNECGLNNRQ